MKSDAHPNPPSSAGIARLLPSVVPNQAQPISARSARMPPGRRGARTSLSRPLRSSARASRCKTIPSESQAMPMSATVPLPRSAGNAVGQSEQGRSMGVLRARPLGQHKGRYVTLSQPGERTGLYATRGAPGCGVGKSRSWVSGVSPRLNVERRE